MVDDAKARGAWLSPSGLRGATRRGTIGLLVAGTLALATPTFGDTALDGDPERGALLWPRCQTCHQIGAGAENAAGPILNNVFDRRAGSVPDFDYSEDLLRQGADGLVWSWEKLDVYLEKPQALVSETNMIFPGIPNRQDRADLIAFLRTFSASPRDIVEAAPTAPRRDPDVDPAILAIDGDREYGEYLSSECITCHQASGADKGIPSITGWPSKIFVIVMHAYKNKARPHPVMQMMAGRLSNEEIAALAAYFEGVE